MPQMVFVDNKQHGKIPASWFIPQTLLDVMDTGQTNRMLHELVQMEAQAASLDFEGVKFPQLSTTEDIQDGFDYVGYRQRLRKGRAEFISRGATNFPKVSDGMKPYISPVIPIGVGLDVNLFELRAANRFSQPIERDRLMDCREYIDLKLDEAWHKGGQNPDGLEIKGMFDYFNGGAAPEISAGTSIYKVPLGTGQAGNTWALKTGAEIHEDIAAGISAVMENSKTQRAVNKIVMGISAWKEITKKTIVSDNGATIRLENYLRTTFPGITWVVDTYFDAIDFDGAPNETWDGQAGSGAVLFYADAENNFSFSAKRFEILRPYDHNGFTTTINTFGLTAGIKMKRTYAFAYMKGVS